MTKRSIASLAIKLMAVFVILTFIPTLPFLLSQIVGMTYMGGVQGALFSLATAFGFPVIWIGIALAIIWASDFIAGMIIPYSEDEEFKGVTLLSLREVQTLVFLCMGMWLVVHALPDLLRLFVSGFLDDRSYGPGVTSAVGASRTAYILAHATQLLLGLGLLSRPRAVTRLVERLQGDHFREGPEPEPDEPNE